MSSVTGIFNSADDADKAVTRLLNDGFTKEKISLIQSDHGKVYKTLSPLPAENANHLAEGGFTGAAVGSALGSLLFSLLAVGSIALPGGAIVMAGPVVAALSGAGAGGILGGLCGTLIGAGLAMDQASRYEEDIKKGKSIVVVATSDEIKEARASIALRYAGANATAA